MSVRKNLDMLRPEVAENVTLVAVSKTYPDEVIMQAYEAGQRIFGENRVQELQQKYESLPKDIAWHMIGHLQTNKVKFIAPFVSLIHGVDSVRLLEEINKQAAKYNRIIDCLLQVHIAEEETKFGFNADEIHSLLQTSPKNTFPNVNIRGLMGMATFTDDAEQIRREFSGLHTLFQELAQNHPQMDILSMGMSGDFKIAIDCGSTMIRIGSSIFGKR